MNSYPKALVAAQGAVAPAEHPVLAARAATSEAEPKAGPEVEPKVKAVPVPDQPIRLDCLTADTLIQTPAGTLAAHSIRPGQVIATRDRDAIPVADVARARVCEATFRRFPEMRPIRIAAGLLGDHGPLLVAPHTRVLVTGALAQNRIGVEAAMVAVRHLVNDRTVAVAFDIAHVDYVHLSLAEPAILNVNGHWCAFAPVVNGVRLGGLPGLPPIRGPEIEVLTQ